jgi:hypothetical protein
MNRIGRLNAPHGSFLTDDDIRQAAPSVFALEAHSSRSERFATIPTSHILTALRREGFDVVQAMQSKTRDDGRREFTKHMLRLRRVGDDTKAPGHKLGDVFPEAVLVNANDGSSTYQLSAGLMRLICLNGMTVSDKSFGGVRVTHSGDVVGKVIEGTFTVLDESHMALQHADAWQQIDLSPREQVAFAESARVLRFGDAEGNVQTPITAEQLLAVRRRQDAGTSLWHTFNRVQEAVIRGGLQGVRYDDRNRPHRVTSRPVNGIGQDLKLNRALWLLAETMADHKQAA